MKKIVYITGCLGFIGSHITKRCLDDGWYVIGIDKITYAANTFLLTDFQKYNNFKFEHKDINDIEFLYDCDYIINTAAETHVDNSIVSSETFVSSNINGVYNLLKLVQNFRGSTKPTLLHFSTDEVYGDSHTSAFSETHLLQPSNPYSATKAAADMMILAWHRTYGVPYIIVRPSNNYGIYQHVEKLIPKSCKFLHLGKKIPLHQNGEPKRTWLHVEDTTNAIITIINNNVVNEIFNIGGNIEQKNIDTVKKIISCYFNKEKNLDFSQFIDTGFHRSGQDLRYYINDNKLRQLGWDNEKDFDIEISKIISYYKQNFIW